jgi:hypothetical protein
VYNNVPKKYDVSAMFQFPMMQDVFEHDMNQTIHYNTHRMKLMNVLDNSRFSVAKIINGDRLPEREYYQKMIDSRIILAPYGFGELPPRDIQSAQFESILIKPDVSYIDTVPNIYVDGETYIACNHDFSDLNEKIEHVLTNYQELQPYFVNNMRKKFIDEYSHEKLAVHWYNIFLSCKGTTI